MKAFVGIEQLDRTLAYIIDRGIGGKNTEKNNLGDGKEDKWKLLVQCLHNKNDNYGGIAIRVFSRPLKIVFRFSVQFIHGR